MEISALHLEPIDMQVGYEDVPHRRGGCRPLAWIRRAIATRKFVAAPMRQRKLVISLAEPAEIFRQVEQPLGDEMDDIAFPLDLAVDRQHRARQHEPALPFEQLWPNDSVDDAGFVLKRHEHHPLGRSRPLANEDKAARHQPATIAFGHGLGTGHDAPSLQVLAQERDRMLAQCQADMGVVLSDSSPARIDGKATSGSCNSATWRASRAAAAAHSASRR